MRIDTLALQLRPRTMPEAADLGVPLVHASAGSLLRTAGPVLLLVALLAASTGSIASWLPSTIFWWLKPFVDRSILFVFSRSVFGERTRFADLWRERRAIFWSGLALTLTVARLSPWRSYVAPVRQLEGLRGAAAKSRRLTLLRGNRGGASLLAFTYANVELVLALGIFSLLVWFTSDRLPMDDLKTFLNTPAGAATTVLLYAPIVAFVEPFFVGSGFAMYLNRRVRLEAWDIEQEFRRVFAR